MKKNLFMLLALATLTISSCSKDEKATKATITLLNTDQSAASGIVVYAYDSGTWDLFGDDEFFADKTASSDANGVCEFDLDNILNLFAFDNQETIYFSAHYSLNGVNTQKFVSITFRKHEQKTATITLD